MNYSNTNIKNNQSFFAKVEIVRILLFHFWLICFPNRAKSGKSFIFYAYTKNISCDFEKRKSKTPPAGQVCKSQNQNQKTYAYTLLYPDQSEGDLNLRSIGDLKYMTVYDLINNQC